MKCSVSSPQNLKMIDALVPLVHELKHSLAKGTRGRSLSPLQTACGLVYIGDPIIITIKKRNSKYGY